MQAKTPLSRCLICAPAGTPAFGLEPIARTAYSFKTLGFEFRRLADSYTGGMTSSRPHLWVRFPV